MKVVKDGSMTVAVEIEMAVNRGHCTTPDGRLPSLSGH